MLIKKFSIRKQEEMLKPELWQTLASRFINDSREDWGWGVKGGDGPRQEGFPVELCSSSLIQQIREQQGSIGVSEPMKNFFSLMSTVQEVRALSVRFLLMTSSVHLDRYHKLFPVCSP